MKELTVSARIDYIDEVLDFVNAELENAECPMRAVTQVGIAVDEIITNICSYAYGDGAGEMTVACNVSDGVIEVTFSDSGIPYNPLEKDDPDITLSLEEREVGGLGIFMVKKVMDEVIYRREGDLNILTIKKFF